MTATIPLLLLLATAAFVLVSAARDDATAFPQPTAIVTAYTTDVELSSVHDTDRFPGTLFRSSAHPADDDAVVRAPGSNAVRRRATLQNYILAAGFTITIASMIRLVVRVFDDSDSCVPTSLWGWSLIPSGLTLGLLSFMCVNDSGALLSKIAFRFFRAVLLIMAIALHLLFNLSLCNDAVQHVAMAFAVVFGCILLWLLTGPRI